MPKRSLSKTQNVPDTSVGGKRSVTETSTSSAPKQTSREKIANENVSRGSGSGNPVLNIREGEDYLSDFAIQQTEIPSTRIIAGTVAANEGIVGAGVALAQEAFQQPALTSAPTSSAGSNENVKQNEGTEAAAGSSSQENSGHVDGGDKTKNSEVVVGGQMPVVVVQQLEQPGSSSRMAENIAQIGGGQSRNENTAAEGNGVQESQERPTTVRNCGEHHVQEATGLGSRLLPALRQKLAANFYRQKYSPANPLDILLLATKQEILQKLQNSFRNMNGTFKSIYFWDLKELGIMTYIRDLIQEIGTKTETKVFTLEMLHTEIIMNEQYQRVNEIIEKTIKQSSVSPCILFIERIDKLMYSIDGPAKHLVEYSLDYLFHYPILLVATSTTSTENPPGTHKLFHGQTIVKLRRPGAAEIMGLFYQVFMKNEAFARKASEIGHLANPPFINCKGCLHTHFGDKFNTLMENIFEVCQGRTAIFIRHVYEIVSQLSEREESKTAIWNNYFEKIQNEINIWKDTGLPDAIRFYDR